MNPILHESFTLSQQAALDKFLVVSQTYFEIAERLSELNLSTLRELAQGNAGAASQLSAAKSFSELQMIQTEMASTQMTKSTEYARAVCEIATCAQANLAKLPTAQFISAYKPADFTESWQNAVSMVSKHLSQIMQKNTVNNAKGSKHSQSQG